MVEKTSDKTSSRTSGRTNGNTGRNTKRPAGRSSGGGARKKPTVTAEPTEIQAPPGFEKVAQRWWATVADLHAVLSRKSARFADIDGAFAREIIARWEYAKALHEGGYQVPDYLTEKALFSPLWPPPQMPAPIREATRAA